MWKMKNSLVDHQNDNDSSSYRLDAKNYEVTHDYLHFWRYGRHPFSIFGVNTDGLVLMSEVCAL
jgi:hypothetical protein